MLNFWDLKWKKKTRYVRWNFKSLAAFLSKSLKTLSARKKLIGDLSYWWPFIYSWPKQRDLFLTSFIEGTYKFEPLKTYETPEETLVVWSYLDRLFVRALLYIIKPLFKHIISSKCLHLKGPSGVKTALNLVKKAFDVGNFRYFMRVDIKSYYASIDRKILTKQVQEYFKDLRILNYLEQIINIPIIKNAAIFNPTLGIPRRSSISPFFGALYLSPLDRIFEKAPGVYYLRFQDDIIILTKTKKQFCRAKRKLQQILKELKLQVSRHKTKMGILSKGFHFLGINFQVNLEVSSVKQEEKLVNNAETQIQHLQSRLVHITLHERCCLRALDNVRSMKADSVHPEKVQSYIVGWARWWCKTLPNIKFEICVQRWVERAETKLPELAWLGIGLLVPSLRLRAFNFRI
jgi:RNA-directed DNA polymerase